MQEWLQQNILRYIETNTAPKRILMCCQPKVIVTPWFVCKVIRVLESIDHLCINLIHRIGLGLRIDRSFVY